MAVYTTVFSLGFRVIVAFGIEGLRHLEDVARAVGDTELAALAPLFDYSDPTLRDLNGLQIKWYTPVFHLDPFACFQQSPRVADRAAASGRMAHLSRT
jgi:hypothetical protein